MRERSSSTSRRAPRPRPWRSRSDRRAGRKGARRYGGAVEAGASRPGASHGRGRPIVRIAIIAAAVGVVAALVVGTAAASSANPDDCRFTHRKIAENRARVWSAQDRLGISRSPVSSVPILGCRYAKWVARLWDRRGDALRLRVVESNRRIARLDAYLVGSPMAGLGRLLDREGREHDVSPYFIAAVAHKESSLGEATCSGNPRNVWGLGACGRAWSPPYFHDWAEAVTFFARFVTGRTHWTSGWPNARTPFDFGGYCDGCEWSWATHVSGQMEAIASTTSVRY